MPPPSTDLSSTTGSRPARSALPLVLSGLMIVIYFGFIYLVGYQKTFLGSLVAPGLSWGILLGALVIVSAWLLTLVYVMSFNRKGGA